LVFTAALCRRGVLNALWTQWWLASTPKMSGNTTIGLHGRRVTVNTGFAYPAFRRKWPTYNDPLVRVVRAVTQSGRSRATVVDVGAAIGDTVLLLADRAEGSGNAYVCVEPDPEFYGHLVDNLDHLADVQVHQAMLADEQDLVPAPVRIHSGTNSPQGSELVPATTLDHILLGRAVHVVKVDTDGFDGKVLAGARRTLRESQPAVIFEWHPALLSACGQSTTLPFEVLTECGYQTFLWFTKHGHFSHAEDEYDPARAAALAQECLTGQTPAPDWHYDVVALPRGMASLRRAIVPAGSHSE
jgi:FkbM family methyltransferase